MADHGLDSAVVRWMLQQNCRAEDGQQKADYLRDSEL